MRRWSRTHEATRLCMGQCSVCCVSSSFSICVCLVCLSFCVSSCLCRTLQGLAPHAAPEQLGRRLAIVTVKIGLGIPPGSHSRSSHIASSHHQRLTSPLPAASVCARHAGWWRSAAARDAVLDLPATPPPAHGRSSSHLLDWKKLFFFEKKRPVRMVTISELAVQQ